MREALRDLAHNGWVLGITCAAALAYSAVRFAEDLIGVVLSILDGYPEPDPTPAPPDGFFSLPYRIVSNGHLVSFEPLLRHSILFVLAVVAVTVVPRLTSTRDEAPT